MTSEEEAQFVELVEWLEKSGQYAEPVATLATYFKQQNTSCKQTDYNLARIETDNVLEVRFWFPLSELAKAASLPESPQFDEWLSAISINGIQASRVQCNKLGECVLLTRLHHIPSNRLQTWLAPDVIGEANFAVLSRSLNMANRADKG